MKFHEKTEINSSTGSTVVSIIVTMYKGLMYSIVIATKNCRKLVIKDKVSIHRVWIFDMEVVGVQKTFSHIHINSEKSL